MKREPARVLAYYNGKAVDMVYVPDSKMRFQLACMRIHDNGCDGYVIDGAAVYFIARRATANSRMAKACDAATTAKVLAEIAALETKS